MHRLSQVMSVHFVGLFIIKIQSVLFQATNNMHNTFHPGLGAKSIWLGKQDHLSAGHGSSAIVGILCNLELVELVTIKFIDKIDFTVIAVALGERIM